MIHHIKRATRHLIFWSLIAAAIGLTGVRLLFFGIEHYKSDLAVHIGEVVGTPVTIGRLGANMRGFNPQLVLKDIAILSRPVPSSVALADNEKPAIEFTEIRLGIDLLELLTRRDLLSSSWVTLVGAKLAIKRQQDGSIVIVGLKSSDGQPQWLLQGRKYEVLQSEISWQDELSRSKPLLFSGVDMAISNEGEQHRLNMLINLPKKVGNTLRLSMDFKGNIFEPSTIQGRVYVAGKAVLLSELAALLGQTSAWDRININAGIGDFKIWGDWRQSQLVAMDVEAQLQQMALVRQDRQSFFVKQLKTRFHWGLNNASLGKDKQWQLDVNDFSLEAQDNPKSTAKKWPSAVFSASGQYKDDNVLAKIALFVEQLDLQEASALAKFFAPLSDDQLQLLAQAQVKGVLQNFSLFADLKAKSLALNGGFSKVGVAPMSSIPGIENLTGRIKGSEKQGTISLTTKSARLSAPELFREALPVDRLQGTLDWRQADNVWSVSSQMIELDSLSFQSKSRLRIDIPETGTPVFMDLQSSFSGKDARQVTHYLPVGIMDEGIVAWLDHAIISGSMTHGGLLVYGNLNDFPFTRAPGVFEAVFNGEQFDLSYAPEWPHITGMNAEVMFSQDSLTVNVGQGKTGNVIIKQAEVTIPTLNKSQHLLIQGKAEAEIGQVLALMQQMPLSLPVDSLLEAITPQGTTQVVLDLKIPLVDDVPAQVDGMAELKDARLTVKSLDLPVSAINGQLKFNERGVFSNAIQATALGHPIQINIESSDSQTSVNVAGKAGIDDLQTQFDLPWWSIAAGETEYRLKLALPYGDVAPELVVNSTLSGVSLDLPGALAKTREQSVPLSLTFSLGDKPLLPMLLNYDDKLKAAMQLDTRQKTVFSGHVLVGAGEVAQSPDAGLRLEINRDRLALQDWLGLAVAQSAGNGVRELKIHSDHALWKQTDIGLFDLALKHDRNDWTGVIASSFANGSIHIPAGFTGTDRISLNMKLLDLSALKQLGSKAVSASQALSPELMPLLTITSDKTLWQSVDLGRLSLEAQRIPGGMSFNNVELTGDNQKLSLSGDWQASGGKSVTHTQGHLEVPRAGQLLAKLGITKDMTETSAVVDFTVNWNAAPYQFSLADLKGEMDITLKNGRILSIEPGFGRVLGMLAMAQWVKRAQLDFSDIYQEGLTFNSIKGHFDLAGGIASTDDLVVDAVPAKIAISGDTDLVSQTVDHIVNVTPKSADAVPIAGTIMGKVAALIGKSLTGKNQEGFFFGSQYQVKGAWGNAQIIPMHKNNGLLQKTWDGITGFPWLPQEDSPEQLEK
ncbi:MAG: YhdP family protein [Methylobacter sp.]|uniref:YhdP family protein n=1 Tax=Candidatus Methylobacter titanis TaxID=3053457 RepID=A0AA43Q5U0_9GAMM|nr:YhdP family protein [Candidatus Methylobacter titanis]